MAAQVSAVKLSNGFDMPIVGLGTWKSEPGVVAQAVKDAIDVGYRHFDCAHCYANENEVGEGLNAKIKEGVVKREELFITSKLWNTNHRPDMVIPACKTTLKNLGLDYLDLYLIHWPIAYKDGEERFPTDANGKMLHSDADYVDTWPEMEKLVELGLVRSIGLSNFNSQQIERVLKVAKIKPVVNQVECHPYLNQKKLMDFCKERGISITAYSPLGSPDRPWAKPGEPALLDDEKLKEMAKKLRKSTAQLVIRYQVERGNVVIPKSVHKKRMAENLDVFNFKLSEQDIQYIDSFDCNGRVCAELGATDHPHYPFHIEF
ncbi:aldo-keto reductase family 1 member B1-like [Neocloeon triangulifer]|uniref:aldo-keto reductase family 1 member B1-like n=1 Tax=Neocloeon triangulifer TaxID=2078957 RepID=UPI00286F028D|nr:aldo-keto reductase family 1 member B1-like [Neocloeon triangulifer]